MLQGVRWAPEGQPTLFRTSHPLRSSAGPPASAPLDGGVCACPRADAMRAGAAAGHGTAAGVGCQQLRPARRAARRGRGRA
eukprot:1750304-Prymnesium_polylepis.1